MRKLFLAFVALLAICLFGCMTTPLTYQEKIKMGGEVAIVDQWATAGIHTRASGFGEGPLMRAVTFVVANPTGEPVKVKVHCEHENMATFGDSDDVEVAPHAKRKVMVLGFNQCMPGVCESERLYCFLHRR